MSIDYKNPKINNIDDILNMEFYTKVYKKKFFWWNVAVGFYEASVLSAGLGFLYQNWNLLLFLSLPLLFFWLLFMIISFVKYFKIWKLASPILNSYDNNVGRIPFSEYNLRGKIERILRACINCILVGGALFIVFFALGWVENNEATQLCVGVVVLFLGVIIPSSVKDKAIPSSCDFLVYIQWREKIRNGVKESKNHR